MGGAKINIFGMNKDKQKAYDNLQGTYCRIQSSRVAGVGVFAIRDIPKGVKLFPGILNQRWYTFKTSELEKLDREVLRMIDDFFVIEKDGAVNIPRGGLNSIDISFFLNNSQNSNAKTIDGEGDFLTFVSTREIKKGEEVTTAYSEYDYKYK